MKKWTIHDVKQNWVNRDKNVHKGSNGKIGIAAGSELMPGAAVLASKAAVYAGAGLTTLSTVKSVIPIAAVSVPEVTYHLRDRCLDSFIDGKNVIAAGPGLGRSDSVREMIRTFIRHDSETLIIDADGLYFLNEFKDDLKKREYPVVITPHAGEMARITNQTIDEINQNRIQTAENTAAELNTYVVLKGPETVTASPDGRTAVNTSGNQGLAKGGSGDVLTGIIAAFLGRYDDIFAGTASAVFLHGHTADYLVSGGTAVDTITPSVLIDTFQQSFNISST
ncbi:NAD(P)H-hydrate dehydratase [Corticicoccus populi]|uniref:ADP-dependent (S)-NAD(P)H-hydrate dehydratase n=1 Tax=Corticicoccus populi TaxID=1812821 RepID=A0ABW5WUK4_9STAP